MPLLEGVRLERNWTSPVGALGGLLAAAGRNIDQVDLMGLTGHAFRLNIDILLTVMGPWDLPWHDVLPLWERLGVLLQGTRARASEPHYPEARALAWRRLCQSIDRGLPVIAYDLLGLPEYGLITGYDAGESGAAGGAAAGTEPGAAAALPPGAAAVPARGAEVPGGAQAVPAGARIAGLTLNEPEQPAWQAYADLPSPGQAPQATKLEIITLLEVGPEPDREQLEMQALRLAVELPYQPGSRDGWTQNGWLAYQHWAAVLNMPKDHAPDGGVGHAYNLMVLQRARRDAAAFLGRLAERHPRARGPLQEAQAAYTEVRDLLTDATKLIAFPDYKGARDPETRKAVAEILRRAMAREREGVDRLEHALRALR
jgi:hypothetical protein